MADSPSSASSLDAIPRRANEEAEEEIPSASATPTHTLAFEYRSAIEAIDAQLPDEEEDDELPEYLGEDDRNAPERQPKGQWRPWPLEEEHATVFEFGRWAWIAVMETIDRTQEQLLILSGYDEDAFRHWVEEDVAEVHAAMLEHNAMVNHGLTIEQWEELAESKEEEALVWLQALRWDTEENRSYWRYPAENPTLALRSYKVFNVSAAEDRQAAVDWAWTVHRCVIYAAHHPDQPPRFPDPALFDVGPGGTEGAVWQLRQFGIFEELRGLKFSRLSLATHSWWTSCATYMHGSMRRTCRFCRRCRRTSGDGES